MLKRLGTLTAALALMVGVAPDAPSYAAATGGNDTVIGKRVIGHSVKGRPIVAWHLGQPGRPGVERVLLIATMHGNESAPRQVLSIFGAWRR